MLNLEFTYNWNNKLNCKAFSTIRLRQDGKYQIGSEFKIILTSKLNQSFGIGEIVDIKHFKLDQLNNFMAYIDTGYSVEEVKKIILRMYPKVDFSISYLSFILIRKK